MAVGLDHCFFQLKSVAEHNIIRFSIRQALCWNLFTEFLAHPKQLARKMYQRRLFILITAGCTAAPLLQQEVSRYETWTSLQQYRLGQGSPEGQQSMFTVPIEDHSPSMRTLEIEQKRQGYLYGPSLLGNTSYFPTGSLGAAMVQQHMEEWAQDASWVNNAVEEEMKAAAATLEKARST